MVISSDGNFTDTQTVFGEVDADKDARGRLEELRVTLAFTSGGERLDILKTLKLNVLYPDGT